MASQERRYEWQEALHTRLSIYMVFMACAALFGDDSLENIMNQLSISRRWWLLYGAFAFFTFIYLKPVIRTKIGSASRSWINGYAIYIAWLLTSMMYHLPTLEHLGINVKADVSLFFLLYLAAFLGICSVHVGGYCVLWALDSPIAVLMASRLHFRQLATLICINAFTVALLCCSYYGYCSGQLGSGGHSTPPSYLKYQVCHRWLGPIPTASYPRLSRLMLWVGESSSLSSFYTVDVPGGAASVAMTQIISPITTLWLTLFMMYVVHAAMECLDSVGRSAPGAAVAPPVELSADARLAAQRRERKSLGEGARQGGPEPPGGAAALQDQPLFLPMVAWFSGTSADIVRTGLQLAISLNLFQGRFDMRAMQSATAACTAERLNEPPAEGDGYTYEQFAERDELWFDFCADTGDGGNATYTVAAGLAAPSLTVQPLPGLQLPRTAAPSDVPEAPAPPPPVTLPRGDLMLIGGDLAYPNPTPETFEQRLFTPFEDALPPPRHYHPNRIVVHKPDLPPDYVQSRHGDSAHGDSPRCDRSVAASALHKYQGPHCFTIPGNHDWIDGLQTYMRFILHRGWLGGWLLPQEKSYFALALPHGWWLLGFDLALETDIDMFQYRYFTHVAEKRIRPNDRVIIMTHEPVWLEDWYHNGSCAPNLRLFVRGHLRGRAKLHISGHLHFYMRHSFVKSEGGEGDASEPKAKPSTLTRIASGLGLSGLASPWGSGSFSESRNRLSADAKARHTSASERGGRLSAAADTPLRSALRNSSFAGGASPPGEPSGGASPTAHRRFESPGPGATTDEPALKHLAASLARRLGDVALQGAGSWPGGHPCLGATSSTGAVCSLTDARLSGANASELCDGASLDVNSVDGASVSGDTPTSAAQAASGGPILGQARPIPRRARRSSSSLDSSSAGGTSGELPQADSPPQTGASSFGSAFRSPAAAGGGAAPGTAAAAGGVRTPPPCPLLLRRLQAQGSGALGRDSEPPSPGPHLYDAPHLICNGMGGAFLHPTHVFSYAKFSFVSDSAADATAAMYSQSSTSNSIFSPRANGTPQQGQYLCASVHPPPKTCIQLGRRNCWFRTHNTTFDCIGGLMYFVVTLALIPRCRDAAAILDAPSLREVAREVQRAMGQCLVDIFLHSFAAPISLAVLFLGAYAFASMGGVGNYKTAPRARSRLPHCQGVTHMRPLLKARKGGAFMRVLFAGVHTGVHLVTGLLLMLLLEVGVEICIRHARLGSEGYNSLYTWFVHSQTDLLSPDSLAALRTYSLGLYPELVQWCMALFDLPEAIAVTRNAICADASHQTPRLQMLGYLAAMLAYYWVLATPMMSFVFGVYLYISVNVFHVHYDEAFSSLKTEAYKGFLKMHIGKDGALEVYALAAENVAKEWVRDARWQSSQGGGHCPRFSHEAQHPSRWVPRAGGKSAAAQGRPNWLSEDYRVVDYVKIS